MITTDKLNDVLGIRGRRRNHQSFKEERVTSLKKMFNLTDNSLLELETKLTTAVSKSDLSYFWRFLKSHNHLQIDGTTPDYAKMTGEEMKNNIIAYEKYFMKKKTASVASLISTSGTPSTEHTNNSCRTLTIFADLKML